MRTPNGVRTTRRMGGGKTAAGGIAVVGRSGNLFDVTPPPEERDTRRYSMPQGWAVTPEMRAIAERHEMPVALVAHEFEKCHAHHLAVGSKFTRRGWATATWTTWVLRWAERTQPKMQPPPLADASYLDEGIVVAGGPR